MGEAGFGLVAIVFDETQQSIIDDLSQTTSGGAIHGSGVGFGKTSLSIQVAINRGAKRVLIIAPGDTLDGWANHVYWMTGKPLRHMANSASKISWIPDETKRHETKLIKFSKAYNQQNLADGLGGAEGWFFITRELFVRLDWDRREKVKKASDGTVYHVLDKKTGKPVMESVRLGVWGEKSKKAHWGMVVYDECQMLSNRDSRSNRSFMYSVKADFKLVQSADWFGNDLGNMLSVAKATWSKELVPWTVEDYKRRFFETEFDPFTYDRMKIVREKAEGEFASLLPCYRALPPGEVQPTPEVIYTDLLPKQAKLYTQLEEDMVAFLEDDKALVVEFPMVLNMRLRELTLGMFDIAGYEHDEETGRSKPVIEFHPNQPSAKLDTALRIMSDYVGEHFILYTHSRKFANATAETLRQKGFKAEAWTGDQSKSARADIKERFLKGETRVLVATTAIAEGIDGLQQVCRNMIILSEDYNELKNRQVVGRIARRGQKRQVNVWKIVARDTIDVNVLHRLIQKALANNKAKALEYK